MVGGVHYRLPGLWVKAATTLDVLSGGRAWLGIGAAWNEEESRGLGFPFPPLGERFEMLEETLRIAHEMWQGERGVGGGVPRPPVPRDAAAELAAVAVAAARPDHDRRRRRAEDAPPRRPVRRRQQRLRRRPRRSPTSTRSCADALRGGRPRPRRDRALDAPERPRSRPTARAARETPAQIVDRFGELADAGAQHVIVGVRQRHDPSRLELIGRDVIPALRSPVMVVAGTATDTPWEYAAMLR